MKDLKTHIHILLEDKIESLIQELKEKFETFELTDKEDLALYKARRDIEELLTKKLR